MGAQVPGGDNIYLANTRYIGGPMGTRVTKVGGPIGGLGDNPIQPKGCKVDQSRGPDGGPGEQ